MISDEKTEKSTHAKYISISLVSGVNNSNGFAESVFNEIFFFEKYEIILRIMKYLTLFDMK